MNTSTHRESCKWHQQGCSFYDLSKNECNCGYTGGKCPTHGEYFSEDSWGHHKTWCPIYSTEKKTTEWEEQFKLIAFRELGMDSVQEEGCIEFIKKLLQEKKEEGAREERERILAAFKRQCSKNLAAYGGSFVSYDFEKHIISSL